MNSKIVPKSLCMVCKDGIKILNDDKVDKNIVGAKAYGLAKIPSAWTLPFFVISSEMHDMYVSDKNIKVLEEVWRGKIIEAMHIMNFDFSQDIYLRSNMCVEDMAERGQFESYDCNINMLFETIKVYFDSIKFPHEKTNVPVLVQQSSQVLGRGHISNERRLSKEHRDWKGEIEQKNWDGTFFALDDIFVVSIRNFTKFR